MLEHNRNTRKEKVLDHNGNTHKVEMHTQMEVLMHIRRKQSCMNPLREDLHGGCIFGFFGDNIFQQLCNQNDIGIHARHCSSLAVCAIGKPPQNTPTIQFAWGLQHLFASEAPLHSLSHAAASNPFGFCKIRKKTACQIAINCALRGKHLASHIDLMSALLLVNPEHHQSSNFIRNRLACSNGFCVQRL